MTDFWLFVLIYAKEIAVTLCVLIVGGAALVIRAWRRRVKSDRSGVAE